VTFRVTPRASANTATPSPACAALASPAISSTDQPSGRKSHAVLVLGAGMPGVSGLANMSGPPISGASAKLPGVGAWGSIPGFVAPCTGRANPGSVGASG
jgi:hypothetical protein